MSKHLAYTVELMPSFLEHSNTRRDIVTCMISSQALPRSEWYKLLLQRHVERKSMEV